jgi:hypothetical protein
VALVVAADVVASSLIRFTLTMEAKHQFSQEPHGVLCILLEVIRQFGRCVSSVELTANSFCSFRARFACLVSTLKMSHGVLIVW